MYDLEFSQEIREITSFVPVQMSILGFNREDIQIQTFRLGGELLILVSYQKTISRSLVLDTVNNLWYVRRYTCKDCCKTTFGTCAQAVRFLVEEMLTTSRAIGLQVANLQ